MADLDIIGTPNHSLNSSQGVIPKPDLLSKTEADLLEGIKDQGVTAVRRITIDPDIVKIPTEHIFATFN